jgi:peptide/nickel transport system substrate-binding protein
MARVPRTLALLSFLALVACAPTAPSSPAPPAEQRDTRQVLNVAVGSITANLTPAAAGGHWIRWQLYDTLTRFGPRFSIEPQVATRWELAPDGVSWRFTIRSDLTFSNGDPLTSEDVIFSFSEMFAQNWPGRANFASVLPESLTRVDATTFEFKTRQPDVTVLASTPLLFIIPKGYYQAVGGFNGFLQKPIGSSPYEVADYRPDALVHFRKRATPHPFRSPQNTDLIFRVVPDSSQQVNGLRTGELDVLTVNTFTPDQLDAIERAGGTVQFFKVSTLAIFYPQGALELRASPLREKRVRQALIYAVNREAIASLFRQAEVASQLAIPDSPYLNPSIRPYPYDPGRARQLLAEAGYPNGFKVESGLEFPAFTIKPEIILAVQADLRAVGVEAQPIPLDFVQASNKGAGRGNEIKAELFGTVVGDTNGFVSGLRQNIGCGKPLGAPPTALWWCNPLWDRLLDQAYSEPDPAKRLPLFQQAAQVMADDVVAMPLIVQPSHSAWSAKIRGVQMPYFFYFTLDSAYRVM